jgi:MFS family permease
MDEVSEVVELSYPSRRYAWFVVYVLATAFAFSLLDRQIIALLVQPIKLNLGLSDTQFSLVAGLAFVTCYCTCGLLFGKFADTHNRRNIIIVAIVLWSFATIACGIAHTFLQLFIVRMLIGVGEAALSPSAYSMIADYFPKEERPKAIGIYTLGSLVGPGIGLMAISPALKATANVSTVTIPLFGAIQPWQAAFLFVGLPGLLVALVLMLVKEPVRHEVKHGGVGRDDLRRFLRRKAKVLALIIITFASNGMVNFCITTWAPAVLIRKFHWTEATVGMSFGLVQLIFATGGVLFGSWWVSRRIFNDSASIVFTTVRNVFLCMAVCAAIMGFSPNEHLTLAAISALVFGGGICSGQGIVALFQVTPNMFRGRMVGVYILMGALLGLGLGASLVAAITDYVFRNERAVAESLAIVVAGASLLGSFCIHRAKSSSELNMEW